MAKKKLKRFIESKSFPNLFEPKYEEIKDGFFLKGKWHSEYFKNNNPITLELGCGKGEYTIELARKYPERNFIGIDWKGARLWRGCRTALDEKLNNVAFIRIKIQNIIYFFDKNETDDIWITFPDPQPRESRSKKRLTSPAMLSKYQHHTKNGSIIHLKTDNRELFDFTLETIQESKLELLFKTTDLYADKPKDDVMITQTFYEKMFLEEGKKINYLKFRFLYE